MVDDAGSPASEGQSVLCLPGEERFGRFSSFFYTRFGRPWLRRLHRFALDRVVQEARKLNPATILDLGSGPGWVSCRVAMELPDVKVCLVDPSSYMLKSAQKLVREQ
ncbi:MAG: class I SAM-dependent methyltransferase, partial [Thermoprotei archaeon]